MPAASNSNVNKSAAVNKPVTKPSTIAKPTRMTKYKPIPIGTMQVMVCCKCSEHTSIEAKKASSVKCEVCNHAECKYRPVCKSRRGK